MKLKSLPKIDLPREKLQKYGVQKLTDHELLALLLGSGIKDTNVLQLSKKILTIVNKTGVDKVNLDQLLEIKGLGKAKASQIIAVLELGKRLHTDRNPEILSAQDIWNQCADFRNSKKEHESGQGADWTKNHLPFEPIHWEIFNTREEAVKREHDLKTGFGRKWLKREYEKRGLARQAGTLHIIDFKTGKNGERDGSLQLPIYLLLCKELRPQWKVSKVSYWYLETNRLEEKELPDTASAYRDVFDVALRVKEARDKGSYVCPNGNFDPATGKGGCMNCRPYEKILQWKAGKLTDDSARLPDGGQVISVGLGGFNQDMFVVK